MFHDAFGAKLSSAPTRWIEPPWKAILSNKGILPAAVGDVSEAPQPAAGLFRGRSEGGQCSAPRSCASRSYSREGANVALVSAGTTLMEQQGPYGAEGFIRQAFAPLPSFSDQYAVVGSWLVDHTPCGLSIREDENPITGNTSRFLPHAIIVARLARQTRRSPGSARRGDRPQGLRHQASTPPHRITGRDVPDDKVRGAPDRA